MSLQIGVGEWRGREGQKIVIKGSRPSIEYPWISEAGISYTHGGQYYSGSVLPHHFDIIGPWVGDALPSVTTLGMPTESVVSFADTPFIAGGGPLGAQYIATRTGDWGTAAVAIPHHIYRVPPPPPATWNQAASPAVPTNKVLLLTKRRQS